MAKEWIYVGLSCGEAGDGIEASAVAISGHGERMKVRVLEQMHRPLDNSFAVRIESAAEKTPTTAALAALKRDLSVVMADAIEALLPQSKLTSDDVEAAGILAPVLAIVSEAGAGVAEEVASPSIIASRTNLPVAAHFLQSDLAAGGIGTPITSWVDWLLLADKKLSRVLIQLGGLARLTLIPAGSVSLEVAAMDVAPAGILLDGLTRRLTNQSVDVDGRLASQGQVKQALLNELLANPYFQRPAPKAISLSEWGSSYVQRVMMMAEKHACTGSDMLATACELVATTLADALNHLTERPHEVILSGGGAMNIHLAGRVRKLLSPSSTYVINKYGLDLRSYRSVCAAVLAAARRDNFAAHCPSASGARKASALGSLTMP